MNAAIDDVPYGHQVVFAKTPETKHLKARFEGGANGLGVDLLVNMTTSRSIAFDIEPHHLVENHESQHLSLAGVTFKRRGPRSKTWDEVH